MRIFKQSLEEGLGELPDTVVHGLCDETSAPHIADSTIPFPFIVVGAATKLRSGGRLADIAPTMLDLMGLECPDEMDGQTLIIE